MPAPIEFSVQAVPREARHWADLARRCEDLGFRALFGPDHPGDSPAPFVALAAAAPTTTTLRLGSYVTNAGVREAIHIATDAATLDLVSGGRAELGLGAGHTPAEWEMTGRTRPGARERVARLCEVASAVRRLLDGQVVPAGEVGALTDLTLSEPRPVAAHVPMLVGGSNATLLRWAGANADAVGLTGLGRTLADGHRHDVAWSPEQVDRHVAMVREGAAQVGREVPVLEVLVQMLDATADREPVLARIAADLDTSPETLRHVPYVLVGTREEIVEQVLGARERWGVTRFVVREHALDAAADILAALHR